MLPPREIAVDAIAVEADAGRHPADDDRELRAVGFAGGFECELHTYVILSEAKDLRSISD
jgi:hypothetical protein